MYDDSGDILLRKETEEKRVFSKEGARLMNQLLSEVVESGTAKSISLSSMVDTAGKTGTSGEDRDRLFVGYTPYYTAGIWMGYEASDRSIGKIDQTHLALWDAVMRAVHEKTLATVPEERLESFSTAGLVRCTYCKDSGCACGLYCDMDLRGDRQDSAYFLKDSRPVGICQTHIPVYYDMENECPATNETPLHALTVVALLRMEERAFPKPIYVSDQKYIYSASAVEREEQPLVPLLPFALPERKKNIEIRK